MTKNADIFFEQFEEIYKNKEQYNMTWAFKDAQSKLNEFRNNVIDNDLKNKCFLCKDKKKANEDYEKMRIKSVGALNKHQMFSSLFANTHNLLSIVEFLISFALVLIISELSHSEETIIFTKAFGVYVVAVFAFLKVIIEQFVLRPKIELLGWKLYYQSVKALKKLTSEFEEQLNLDIIEELA